MEKVKLSEKQLNIFFNKFKAIENLKKEAKRLEIELIDNAVIIAELKGIEFENREFKLDEKTGELCFYDNNLTDDSDASKKPNQQR